MAFNYVLFFCNCADYSRSYKKGEFTHSGEFKNLSVFSWQINDYFDWIMKDNWFYVREIFN
jgi:hypothetical protein